MIKISTNLIKPILEKYNNKSMYLYLNGIISGRFTIHLAKCTYNEKTGIIHIYDKMSRDYISINTTAIYMILTDEKNNNTLEIRTDSNEIIKIKI